MDCLMSYAQCPAMANGVPAWFNTHQPLLSIFSDFHSILDWWQQIKLKIKITITILHKPSPLSCILNILCILYVCCMWMCCMRAKKISVAMLRLHLWWYYFSSPSPPPFPDDIFWNQSNEFESNTCHVELNTWLFTGYLAARVCPQPTVPGFKHRYICTVFGSKELFSTMYYIEFSWQKVIANVEMLTHDKLKHVEHIAKEIRKERRNCSMWCQSCNMTRWPGRCQPPGN